MGVGTVDDIKQDLPSSDLPLHMTGFIMAGLCHLFLHFFNLSFWTTFFLEKIVWDLTFPLTHLFLDLKFLDQKFLNPKFFTQILWKLSCWHLSTQYLSGGHLNTNIFQPSFFGSYFLEAKIFRSNCHVDICFGDICPGNICPYQEYLSCYWQNLKAR